MISLCVFSVNLRDLGASVVVNPELVEGFAMEKRSAQDKDGVALLNQALVTSCIRKRLVTKCTKVYTKCTKVLYRVRF